MTSGAFTAAFLELAPEYEADTHNKLQTEFGPSMGATYNAIPCVSPVVKPLTLSYGQARPRRSDQAGKVRANSRVELVQSKIGMAVKAGAPHPDISTLEA